MAPTPAAPQALSAPPPTTGVPGAKPVSAPANVVTRPSTSADPPTSGNNATGSSAASSISRLRPNRAGPDMGVPEVSYGAVANAAEGLLRGKFLAGSSV